MGGKAPGDPSSSPSSLSPSLISANPPHSSHLGSSSLGGVEPSSIAPSPPHIAVASEAEFPPLRRCANSKDHRPSLDGPWIQVKGKQKTRSVLDRSSSPSLAKGPEDCAPSVCEKAQEKSGNSTRANRNISNAKPMSFKSTPCSWAAVVSGFKQGDEDHRLQYVEPSSRTGSPIALISCDELSLNARHWANTLLLYVVGQRPLYHHLKAYIQRKWNPINEWELLSRDNGVFLVRFDGEEDCSKVLSQGPWLFDNRLMIIKRWTSDLRMDRDLLKSLPLWIRLPGLNLRLWNPLSISKIASVVGIPLYMDAPTASMSRVSYARVFVEVSSSSPLPKSVDIMIEDGECLSQEVIYEWTPPLCSNCKYFGHLSSQCTVALNQVWVPRKSSSPSPFSDSVMSDIVGATLPRPPTPVCEPPVLSVGADLSPGNVSSSVMEQPHCPVVAPTPDPRPSAPDVSLPMMLDRSTPSAVPINDHHPPPEACDKSFAAVVASSDKTQGSGHRPRQHAESPPKAGNENRKTTNESWAKKGFLSKGLGGSKQVSETNIFDILDATNSDDEDEYVEEDEDMCSDSEDRNHPSEFSPSPSHSHPHSYANPKWEEMIGAFMKEKDKKYGGRKPANAGVQRSMSKIAGAPKGFNMALRSTKKN